MDDKHKMTPGEGTQVSQAFTPECGSSSVGRATAFQAVGRGFEPRLPLKNENR